MADKMGNMGIGQRVPATAITPPQRASDDRISRAVDTALREAQQRYLVRVTDHWVIARPGVIFDDTTRCNAYACLDGFVQISNGPGSPSQCTTCHGVGRLPSEERTLRLAWFDVADDGMICFDYAEPEVQLLPE